MAPGGMSLQPVREFSSVAAAAGAAHELYDAECAGARLCRAIEAGEEPLPQGFDDVAHFRLVTMALLLSTGSVSLSKAIDRHFPEHGDVVVSHLPGAKMEALREALVAGLQQSPVPSLVMIRKSSGVVKTSIIRHGPDLCPEYMIHLRGPMPAEKVARMRELLQERRHSLRDMGRQLAMSAAQLRWYIRYYEPGVVLPYSDGQPVRQLARPEGLGRLTLGEYTRRFLPATSPVHQAPPGEGSPAGEGTHALVRVSAHRQLAYFDPRAHGSGPGTNVQLLAPGLSQNLEAEMRGLAGLRPMLAEVEIGEYLGISSTGTFKQMVSSFGWPEGFWDSRPSFRKYALADEDIRRLRRLAKQVHPSGRRMRFTVRELAVHLGQQPDVLFGMLYRYAPEYFFLALGPGAGSGPGGMYVPEGKLADLLAAVEGKYPRPVLHQVAADLGCALPQVVNSLRLHAARQGVRFMAPDFMRHAAARAFQVEQAMMAHPGASVLELCASADDLTINPVYDARPYICFE
ncbi:hypothetical protein H696_02545 [Fonticula alba]|uniref:Uncharacterized protein n=1 Tax=Fonticula alba TaxID=691883 RepID=A0A058Z7D1_FONAL|nr:hypothetical protein H696_02545 [Fonticula alba]KCV70209.1 hypothetical protein H696_02545 [Fonticula alba]|eukprot:XP_009494725.1 hypothetical protein H696_02545 [Fonticula alba]